jgi:hypothetical protein
MILSPLLFYKLDRSLADPRMNVLTLRDKTKNDYLNPKKQMDKCTLQRIGQ